MNRKREGFIGKASTTYGDVYETHEKVSGAVSKQLGDGTAAKVAGNVAGAAAGVAEGIGGAFVNRLLGVGVLATAPIWAPYKIGKWAAKKLTEKK